jgi:hypothetical protein
VPCGYFVCMYLPVSQGPMRIASVTSTECSRTDSAHEPMPRKGTLVTSFPRLETGNPRVDFVSFIHMQTGLLPVLQGEKTYTF